MFPCEDSKTLSVCPYPEERYHSFVNISPTLVIDTSMERSSLVLHHGNPEMWKFFKKFEIEFDLYFDLCQRAEIIQVGLNMHPYVDIGDASSSLWRSTSSFKLVFKLMAGNQKMLKWIESREYWSKCNVLYINRFVLTSSTNWWKAFFKFRISFQNFDWKPRNIKRLTKFCLCKRGRRCIRADQVAFQLIAVRCMPAAKGFY